METVFLILSISCSLFTIIISCFYIAGSILVNSDLENDFVFEKEFWSKNYNDFLIQFPQNATIMPGETQIISMHTDSIFYDYYYYYPDYNIHELTTKGTESFLGGNSTIDYLEDKLMVNYLILIC